jgi:hypothetical protein
MIISGGCEHASILRVPGNSVDTISSVARKSLDQLAVLPVPDVYLGVCIVVSISIDHI